MIEPNKLTPFRRFCVSVGAIPTSYMESMTYYEMLEWLCKYLQDTVIPAINTNAEAVEEMQQLFLELKDYVDHYFDTLDIQTEVDAKLDEMAQSGELAELVAQYLDLGAIVGFDTVADMKAGTNFVEGSKIRTLGRLTYNDGKGAYYRVRPVLTTDVIDDINIVGLTNFPSLIAEIILSDIDTLVPTLQNDLTKLEGQVHAQPSTTCKEVAHRGAPEDTIENTITSFNYAYNKGFEYFECDLQTTLDGYMVLFHNATVDSTTNGTGTVNNLTYSYLRGLTYTVGGNIANYPNTQINDLSELITFLKQTDIKCFLEIKETWSNEKLDELYSLIKNNGLLDKVIFTGFNPNYLLRIRNIDSNVPIMYLLGDLDDTLIDYCKLHNFIAGPVQTNLTKELVDSCHANGVAVYSWTVTSIVEYQALLNKNVDFICTNSRLYCYPSLTKKKGYYKYVYPYYSEFDKKALEKGYNVLANGTGTGYPSGLGVDLSRAVSVTKIPVKNGDTLSFSFDTTKYSIAFPGYSKNNTPISDSGWQTGTSYTFNNASVKWTYCYFKKNNGTAFKDYELDEVGAISQDISITRV